MNLIANNFANIETANDAFKTPKNVKIVKTKVRQIPKIEKVERSFDRTIDISTTRPLSNINYDKMLEDDYEINGINRDDYFLRSMLNYFNSFLEC